MGGPLMIRGFVAHVESGYFDAVDVKDETFATEERNVDDERRLEPGEL